MDELVVPVGNVHTLHQYLLGGVNTRYYYYFWRYQAMHRKVNLLPLFKTIGQTSLNPFTFSPYRK
jgi:hypothetical protein